MTKESVTTINFEGFPNLCFDTSLTATLIACQHEILPEDIRRVLLAWQVLGARILPLIRDIHIEDTSEMISLLVDSHQPRPNRTDAKVPSLTVANLLSVILATEVFYSMVAGDTNPGMVEEYVRELTGKLSQIFIPA